MKKITLFSLSLVMISACNAMNEDSNKQEAQEQKPNIKLTRRVLNLIKNANLSEVFEEELSGEIYHLEVDKDKKFSLDTNDYIHPIEAKIFLRRQKISNGLSAILNRLYPDKQTDIISAEITFDIHGAENIEQFEKEFNFKEDLTAPRGSLFHSRHAQDNKMLCAMRSTGGYSANWGYFKEGAKKASYECVINNMPVDEFIKELDALETDQK